MHQPQTWLLVLLSWSSYVSAFYPYNVDVEKRSVQVPEVKKRFYPFRQSAQSTDDANEGLLKLDIHKVSKQKRDNEFSVVFSNDPTGGPNALAINQDGSDYSYFSTMKFGSKAQPMYMLIDTGSANTWVFSSDCKSDTCSIHNTFGKEDSTTLKSTTDSWDLAYGTGSVSGIVGNDTVAFANFTLNMGFGLAVNASDDFNNYPMDGILGLGRRISDQLGTPTVMDVLQTQGKLSQNVIGVHLHRAADGSKDGEIVFGGIDTGKFSGNLAYTKTANDNAWEIPVDDFLLNGTPCNFTGRTAIIDTGTTFILMPPNDADALHNLISGSAAVGEGFTVPCNANAKLEVKINGKLYQIQAKDYIGKAVSGSTTTCSSNIIGHQAFGPQEWILGDVFLKNVYAVFDFDGKQIGFGMPGSGGSTNSAIASSSSTTSGSTTVTATPSSSSSKSGSKTASASSSGATTSSTGSADSSLGQDGGSRGAAGKSVVDYWKVGFSIVVAFTVALV